MNSKRKQKTQARIFREIQNQLLLQAERLNKRDYYTPYRMEEMRQQSLREILTELYIERANLEYEMQVKGTDKHEILRKLEKLHRYITKAEALSGRTEAKMQQLVEGKRQNVREDLLCDLPQIRVAV